ncbi:MAG TPA: peptidoglycan-binding protein [Thermoanaerobaculia bacterium]|nr:peptidoglycan-binding protein [Thermoanaerobaculia bacterium]
MANPEGACVERVTVEVVCEMFPGAPRKNIEAYLPAVLDALSAAGLADLPMVLMALGTIRAETAGFAPLSEYKSKWNTSPEGHPFDLYDDRGDLGNQGAPDGDRFKGRGFIQLTGRANYQRIGAKLGLGGKLVEDPELANDAAVAARILAAFLADKQGKIRPALAADDLARARRLVNGGSHGLAAFEECYRTGERLLA